MNEIECVTYFMHKAKVCKNDLEYNNDTHLNGFIKSCKIRKIIEKKEKKCG